MLSVSDTELCALLSNGLENALIAAGAREEEDRRWISCYCGIRAGKLLIEIRNPYAGVITMREDLPVSDREDHSYSCRSIRAIVGRNRGLCTFTPENGVVTLRIALPLR